MKISTDYKSVTVQISKPKTVTIGAAIFFRDRIFARIRLRQLYIYLEIPYLAARCLNQKYLKARWTTAFAFFCFNPTSTSNKTTFRQRSCTGPRDIKTVGLIYAQQCRTRELFVPPIRFRNKYFASFSHFKPSGVENREKITTKRLIRQVSFNPLIFFCKLSFVSALYMKTITVLYNTKTDITQQPVNIPLQFWL